MPELSRFFGIVIRMYYRDHPPPHFHAERGEYEVVVDIETGIVQGRFPRRALSLVMEWHAAHRDELMQNWERARRAVPLTPVAPLE